MVKMKHCCKNVVILMPEPVAEPALNGLRLNLRIVSIVMFNFASYLTIGLPLAVLPGYVHDVMGFSAFWAGLVISLQYFATLLSRPHAGRYADLDSMPAIARRKPMRQYITVSRILPNWAISYPPWCR